MRLDEFDYELPEGLIAQYPPARRGNSRLILLDRDRDEVRETTFSNFTRYLMEGDIVVVNETKVIPARIFGRKRTGGKIEIFLVKRTGEGEWLSMLRPSRRVRPGDSLLVGDEGYEVVVRDRTAGGEWRVILPGDISEDDFMERFGHVPLPPYIKRGDDTDDRNRYQTIYAKREGSVASPTAGLHFNDEILRMMRSRGVTLLPLTLHVGPGTFRPLADETVENNTLPPEYVMIKEENWREIVEARELGRRVIAVGTTTTRALEAIAAGGLMEQERLELEDGAFTAGWTDLFIYPGFVFRVIDSLLTNLHLPRSSLLLLVAAFASRDKILETYKWAIERRFRFYSYGDVMFIR